MNSIVDAAGLTPARARAAIRRGEITGPTTGFCAGGLGKLIGALYTATWLYPDECADIDPDAVFDEWMSMQEVGPIEGHVYRLP